MLSFRSNDGQRFCMSQPDPTIESNEFRLDNNNPHNNNNNFHGNDENTIAWSQPANINDMLLSQIVTTPGSASSASQVWRCLFILIILSRLQHQFYCDNKFIFCIPNLHCIFETLLYLL